MKHQTKKIISASFATISALVVLATTMDFLSASSQKIATYFVGALSIVGTTFLPAVIGGGVPKKLEIPDPPKGGTNG